MESVSSNILWQLCQKVFSDKVCRSKRGDDISLSFLECGKGQVYVPMDAMY